LLVCGSSPAHAAATIRQARDHGLAVLPMPKELLRGRADSRQAMQSWAQQARDALVRTRWAVVSIGQGADRPGSGTMLTARLAELVSMVLAQGIVAHVYAEGGATAAVLAKRMGWEKFHVEHELAPGVVSLRAVDGEGLMLTMKPGSYAWPQEIWA
jgi:uncharacterized protein YgbK (DUF1537 family)